MNDCGVSSQPLLRITLARGCCEAELKFIDKALGDLLPIKPRESISNSGLQRNHVISCWLCSLDTISNSRYQNGKIAVATGETSEYNLDFAFFDEECIPYLLGGLTISCNVWHRKS
jgi:hypothetical protein